MKDEFSRPRRRGLRLPQKTGWLLLLLCGVVLLIVAGRAAAQSQTNVQTIASTNVQTATATNVQPTAQTNAQILTQTNVQATVQTNALTGQTNATALTNILHLKNGDRIAGVILSEDTNRVVISTTWIKELIVPVSEITNREKLPAEAKAAVQEPAVAVQPKPAPPSVVTNTGPSVLPSARPGTPVAIAVAAPPPKAKPKNWKGEVKVGADFLFNSTDQELYYGRAKLVYEHPYATSPKQFFRNILDYSVDYGRSTSHNGTNPPTSITSANKMNGSDKIDFDIGTNKLYAYNLAGAGYDEVRKINFRYEVGPGLGYHLFRLTNFVANAEVGFNYQEEHYDTAGQPAHSPHSREKFFFRLGEDVTWKPTKQLAFTEKCEFFPRVEKPSEYRMRFESTVSYGLFQHISVNLSLLDIYDRLHAPNVPPNDLQIRSSLGFTF
jgi:hypothetical protein